MDPANRVKEMGCLTKAKFSCVVVINISGHHSHCSPQIDFYCRVQYPPFADKLVHPNESFVVSRQFLLEPSDNFGAYRLQQFIGKRLIVLGGR